MDVAVVIALVSVAVSATAFARIVHSDRRRLLAQLHAEFIAPANSLGRAQLHEVVGAYAGSDAEASPAWWDRIDGVQRAQINSAIAQLDAAAFQAVRGYVSRRDALMLWGSAASLCWHRAKPYVDHRRSAELGGSHLWLWLEEFVRAAEARPEITRNSTARRASVVARWL